MSIDGRYYYVFNVVSTFCCKMQNLNSKDVISVDLWVLVRLNFDCNVIWLLIRKLLWRIWFVLVYCFTSFKAGKKRTQCKPTMIWASFAHLCQNYSIKSTDSISGQTTPISSQIHNFGTTFGQILEILDLFNHSDFISLKERFQKKTLWIWANCWIESLVESDFFSSFGQDFDFECLHWYSWQPSFAIIFNQFRSYILT